MRRDCVTQVIVRWRNGEEDNFATPFEAENYINWALDELGEPEAAWICRDVRNGITASSKMRKVD